MPEQNSPRPKRHGWLILAMLAVVLSGAGAAWWQSRVALSRGSVVSTMAAVDDPLARAPIGVRVRVRVLNASGTRGYARRATLELRDRGFDVVEYETEQGKARKSTLILSHTSHPEWAERLQRAFGTGAIEERPDSLRYVDLTIFVGLDWKPATETLRP